MGFQDDWILRQIDIVSRFVARLVFGKDEVSYEPSDSEVLSETDWIFYQLERLIQEKCLGEAEDLLFDNLQFSDRYTELALDFYTRLNRLSDRELEEGGFSREEVYDGFVDIMTRLGVPVEQFLS